MYAVKTLCNEIPFCEKYQQWPMQYFSDVPHTENLKITKGQSQGQGLYLVSVLISTIALEVKRSNFKVKKSTNAVLKLIESKE